MLKLCPESSLKKLRRHSTIKLRVKGISEIHLIRSKKAKIKLLGKGDIKIKVDIEVSAFSKSAKENIEKIGGSVIILDEKKTINQDKKTGV